MPAVIDLINASLLAIGAVVQMATLPWVLRNALYEAEAPPYNGHQQEK